MYDIIPSGGAQDDRPARPLRPSVGKKSGQRKVVYAGPRTVQLEWKLPSRLRKPIRQQLAKQRAQKRRRQAAAVSFARKPIRTQPLLVADADNYVPGARVQKPRRFFNRGVEHHTGDMYKQGKPELHVAAPPYIGRVARRKAGVKASPRPPRRHSRRLTEKAPRPAAIQPLKKHIPVSTMPLIAERDIPMQWDSPDKRASGDDAELFAAVQPPKRVLPGVTLNLWPGHWFGNKKQANQEMKSRSELLSNSTSRQQARTDFLLPGKKKRLTL